jgi:nicotinate-nucleotide pyrophosphorylase (carboxylating)
MPLLDAVVEPIVRNALIEDIGRGPDLSAALLPIGARFSGMLRARKAGIVAGLQAARLAFRLVDDQIAFTPLTEDGESVDAGTVLARIEGSAASVVTAERTALNFLTLLSGCATLTGRYVDAVAGTQARIAATRKTLPGLRTLQKEAVRLGGGWPHRFGLDDAILVKDNHIAAAGSVSAALARAKEVAGHMRVIEVEVDSLAQLEEALSQGPQIVLLDNFSTQDLIRAVALTAGRATLEASGGVTLMSVSAIAQTGVDVISVGALTHSAPALDIGLDAA